MSSHAASPPHRRGLFRRSPRDDAPIGTAGPVDPVESAPTGAPPLPRREPDATRARIGRGYSAETSALRRTQVAARASDEAPYAEPPAWAVLVAPSVTPVLDDLVVALGGSATALLSTTGGAAIAATGLDAESTRRLASAHGSLHAVSTVTAAEPVDWVGFTSGTRCTVVLAVGATGVLLSATADEVSLGVLLVRARQSAQELESLLPS